MELLKRNIHMDRVRTQAVTQFTLEDDVNIPESKPDVSSLNLEKGELLVEEIKPATDYVTVRGCLQYKVLYHTMEEDRGLVVLEGQLPFEERIQMQGVTPADMVAVDGMVEDISVNTINSRKLNVQSLLSMKAKVTELYDEEIPVAVHGEEKVEYRKMPLSPVQIVVCKNDIFRLKEEVTLPSNYPNIFQILWSDICLRDVEFKVMDERLALSGDVQMFVMYEGEGEDHPCRCYETTMPFSGVLECHGCREGMIPDIRYRIGQQELTIRPDFDGEERNVGVEMTLDINIRIYEEEKLEMITDIYGVSKEVDAVTDSATLRKLLACVTGKTKVTDRIRVNRGTVLQLMHSEGHVVLENVSAVENGILLQGSIQMKVMYITEGDDSPYGCTQAQIPYQYTLEVPDVASEDLGDVRAEIEQMQVTMLDGEEMDVKVVLSFSTVVFKRLPMNLIRRIDVTDLDTGKLSSLPGMVVYVVKSGDNLWNIGKKYYVPVDVLKELNGLDSDELKVGQKLLIVKGI